ncbi:hypothetical protein Tco_0912655 [Tanacetum coccineum]
MPQTINNYAAKYNYDSPKKEDEEKKKRLSTLILVYPSEKLPFKLCRSVRRLNYDSNPIVGLSIRSVRLGVMAAIYFGIAVWLLNHSIGADHLYHWTHELGLSCCYCYFKWEDDISTCFCFGSAYASLPFAGFVVLILFLGCEWWKWFMSGPAVVGDVLFTYISLGTVLGCLFELLWMRHVKGWSVCCWYVGLGDIGNVSLGKLAVKAI